MSASGSSRRRPECGGTAATRLSMTIWERDGMTGKPHLIVGNSLDYHAAAIQWALKELGERAYIWDGITQFEDGAISFWFSDRTKPVCLGREGYESFSSVWFRRQVPYGKIDNVAPDALAFLRRELTDSHFSLCALAESMADFVIGGSATRNASAKAWQLKVASMAGFSVPATLISNDYERVKNFVSHGPVLVKHFAPHYFVSGSSGATKAVGPSVIEDFSKIDRSTIEICPCIYQKLIEKDYEIRLTVIGEHMFAAKIYSADGTPYLDWRPQYGKAGFRMSPIELNDATLVSARRLMDALRLPYGCVDLVVDSEGQVHFLEINPGGQFLFVEDQVASYPLLLAFASMLAARSPSFTFDRTMAGKVNMGSFERSEDFSVWEKNSEERSNEEKFVTIVD